MPRQDSWLPGLAIAIWAAIYTWRGLAGFYSLNTNAFDLSIFDYAIVSLGRGEPGSVPFLGHSLLSHHFMPILVLLAPIPRVFGSPAALLVVQVAAIAGAAALLATFNARLRIAPLASAGLVFVFLFARRTHGAMAGMFYPEAFQAPLIVAMVLAWTARAWRTYWIVVVLLLMTKEDAAIYVGAFACLQAVRSRDHRRQSLLTAGIAAAWLLAAVLVAIPAARTADGLPPGYEALSGRYGAADGSIDPGALAGRLASVTVLERSARLLADFGLLPIAGAVWLLPALPGLAINLAADPTTMQADLTHHYAWPILPWMAMAAALGWQRLRARWRHVALVWLAVLVVFTAVDSPALQRAHRTRIDPSATEVLRQIEGLSAPSMLVQPNLIPHLPRTAGVFAAGGSFQPPTPPDLVLLTEVGNLWPFTPESVRQLIADYDRDPRYERIATGPLHAFRRRAGR